MRSLLLMVSTVFSVVAISGSALADKGGIPNANASEKAAGSANAMGANPNVGPGNNSGNGGGDEEEPEVAE